MIFPSAITQTVETFALAGSGGIPMTSNSPRQISSDSALFVASIETEQTRVFIVVPQISGAGTDFARRDDGLALAR